jgi:hypothetical protein
MAWASRLGVRTTFVTALALVLPAAAFAAPPPNDQRSAAQGIAVPASVGGTTTDSTLEPDEPVGCAPLRGSVYYQLRAPSRDRIVVRLAASGDLDATVEVFRRTRSQLEAVGCEVTDRRGNAGLEFRPVRGGDYLIRVGQRANSAAGNFRLDVFAPQPPPRGPGAPLRARGADGRLDALQDTQDAWSYRMRAGTTYRLNLTARPCMSLQVYAPGTQDFERSSPVRSAGCDGYLLFTPEAGEGGRYSFLVSAQPRRPGEQSYHLQAAPAGVDDTAPGLPLPNLRRVRGSLRGNAVDTVDLYRFSIARRSALELTLSSDANMSLVLLDDLGRRRGGGTEVSRRIRPGRYFVAVRTRSGAVGRYTLQRVSRTITRTSVTIDGKRNAEAAPGETVRIGVDVAPGASGPVQVTIERFDPLAGWQFFRQVRTTAAGGSAGVAFTPPTEGRWRARAVFPGTRIAAPSESGYAHLLVAPPLAP